jgi:hypothetical protein
MRTKTSEGKRSNEQTVFRRHTGRPTKFTANLATEICERIALGESLRKICRDRHMPDLTTVIRWTYTNESFCNQYVHARERQADLYFDSLLDLAESATEKDAHVVRLRVDTLKWILARMRPNAYSERLQIQKQEPPVETHEDRMRKLWAEINVKVKVEDRRAQEVDVTPSRNQIGHQDDLK